MAIRLAVYWAEHGPTGPHQTDDDADVTCYNGIRGFSRRARSTRRRVSAICTPRCSRSTSGSSGLQALERAGHRQGTTLPAPTFAAPPGRPVKRTGATTVESMEDDAARNRLAEEQARLAEIRDNFVADGLTSESEDESLGELSSVDQHQADVGTETFNRERDLSILERVQAELADVEHALRRLDDGTYGTCEACNKPIDESRLEALPAARFCLQDQATAEREVRLPGGNT